MPQDSYAYAVGRIRVLENRLLDSDRLERMISAPSPEDVIKILVESGYGAGQENISPYDYEKLLAEERKKTYRLVNEITPNRAATDLFLLQYDIHNLKVLLKIRFLERVQEEPLSKIGTISTEDLRSAVFDKNYEKLPAFIVDTLDELENILSIKVDPQKIDTMLDRVYYDYVFEVCGKRRNSFLKEFFTRRVDLLNIKTVLRVIKIGGNEDFLKELLINHGSFDTQFLLKALKESPEQLPGILKNTEYEKMMTAGIQSFVKDKTLTVFERLEDDFLLNFVRVRRHNPFGIEALIGYILARENEQRLVRIIMVGKINNIPEDRVRERLRDVYV